MLKVNDLVGYKNRKIYQDDNYFCFSVDSVFLSNFATFKKHTKRILDIGTGVGVIPLILTLRKDDLMIDAIEIQKELVDLALKSVKLNKLEDSINVIHQDILEYIKDYKDDKYDLIICNPPYFKCTEQDKVSDSIQRMIARHEVTIKLEDYFITAKELLANSGMLSMIHRTERFLEVIELYKQYNISPTRVKFIHSTSCNPSKLFFIEGIKSDKGTLIIEDPFIIYDKDNNETEEYKNLLKYIL